MKLRYYLSGLGSGIIIAVLIMLIADKVTAVNNNVNGSNVPQETTGSVIAYTTQSDKDNETIQAESTEHSENKGNEDTTSADTAKNSVVKATDSSTTDTTRYVSEEDKVIVNINPKNIKVAADISKILKNKGVIEDADAFTQYMATYGYAITAFTDAGIQYIGEEMTGDLSDGDFALIKGDSYENIARIITRSDVDNNTNTQAD